MSEQTIPWVLATSLDQGRMAQARLTGRWGGDRRWVLRSVWDVHPRDWRGVRVYYVTPSDTIFQRVWETFAETLQLLRECGADLVDYWEVVNNQ